MDSGFANVLVIIWMRIYNRFCGCYRKYAEIRNKVVSSEDIAVMAVCWMEVLQLLLCPSARP